MDSENGGIPSPILGDRFIMLPIPTDERLIRYSDLHVFGDNLGKIVSDLSQAKIAADASAHVDPDLDAGSIERAKGWRPLFGQTGAAASHLRSQGVTVGDLFLFFGWFRKAERCNDRFRYQEGSPSIHVLFGWLQVGAVVNCADPISAALPWAHCHPHFSGGYGTAYLASHSLKLGGPDMGLPGAGIFRKFHQTLRLTSPNQPKRSVWQMPRWFFPRHGKYPLSFHSDHARYFCAGDHVQLQTVSKGQEFIINTHDYPEALAWARKLISAGTRKSSRVSKGP